MGERHYFVEWGLGMWFRDMGERVKEALFCQMGFGNLVCRHGG